MARGGTRRGAQPRSSGGSSGGGQKHTLWLVGGLLAGWLTAFGVYLLDILPTALEIRERNASVADCDDKAAKPAPAQAANGKAGDKPVEFQFYTMLPQQEVVAPVVGDRTTQATPPPTATSPGTNPAPAATTGAPRYQLQAGSFRTRPEADKRRAALTLSGYSVNIQDVKTSAGETWYRVMVGPFADEASVQKARQALAAQKIDTLPIRLK